MDDVAAVALVAVLTAAGVPLALWMLATRAIRRAGSGAEAVLDRVLRRAAGRPAWEAAGRAGRQGLTQGLGLLLGRVRLPLAAVLGVLALLALLLAAGSGARSTTAVALALGLIGLAVTARVTLGVAGRILHRRR
ncbi:MAG TPA: hypothetical protein VNT51_04550 [Miltoncostaeaceae bacterium]|nr:hypothetical protein [Miltoncostaeaceae bacterium]